MPQYEFHPLANAYPMLTGWDYEQLKRDLQANGQLNRIAIWQGQILDGRNRYKALTELGVEPAVKELEFTDEAAARAFVESMNDRRRHESADVVRARTEQRRETVAKLRAEGKSTRAIANEVGVTHTQVRRDLDSTGTDVPVQPATITGRDGKRRPATRKTKYTKTIEEPVDAAEDDSACCDETTELNVDETTEAILNNFERQLHGWAERLGTMALGDSDCKRVKQCLAAVLRAVE